MRRLVLKDRKVHGTLPDSRPRKMTGAIPSPFGTLVKCYCANCGADGGYALEDLRCEIFYLCERCEDKGKGLGAAARVPEGYARRGDWTAFKQEEPCRR